MASPSTPLDHDADEFIAGRDLIEERAGAAGLEVSTVYRAHRLCTGDLTFSVVVLLKREDVAARIAATRADVARTVTFNPDTVVVDPPSPGASFAAARARFASALRELDAEAGRLSRGDQRRLWDGLLEQVGERLVKAGGES